MSIYVLSGKVFGKNIYEINYTDNLHDRLQSDVTGYPESNVLHFNVSVEQYCKKECQNLIYDMFYHYQLKTNSHYYKIKLTEATSILDKIILNLSYSKKYQEEQTETEIKTRRYCF